MNKIIFTLALTLLVTVSCSSDQETRYLAADTNDVMLYSIDGDEVAVFETAPRGSEVSAFVDETEKVDGEVYVAVKKIDEVGYIYAKEESLVKEQCDAVQERVLWVRTPASIIDDIETSHIAGLAKKGEEVQILGYEMLKVDGSVSRYRVKCGSLEGYIHPRYLVATEEEANKNFKADVYDKVHSAVKNTFGGGKAIDCDFFPVERVEFENNKMPEACYSLYLNNNPSVLNNIEKYIELAKTCKINTFVIDIKDNERPGYKADAMDKHSPTNYKQADKRGEKLYKEAVKRLHEEGYYVVGRITCFKDTYLVKDHSSLAITDKATGKPFYHNKAYWPSPYNRKVWQFNVELAKESVEKFGFDEINFDYVRFPDRMTSVEKLINYHNEYDESKVQAIQRFVQYACDEIHAVGAYVSIDVFGESANPGYTTAYGQYWPAISNVCDAICGMPYPDHFTSGYYGIKKPWNNPYGIMLAWGKRVQDRQAVTPTPAAVRTWIQAYPVMRHVDSNGLPYNAEDVEAEIRGLYDAGLTGGYTTWHSGSKLDKYKAQQEAFCVDYLKEWKEVNNVK